MSDDKGSEDFNENNGTTKVDNTEEDKEKVDLKPDVSMFGESTGMADAVLVVEGVRIPVIKGVLGVASPVLRDKFRAATGETPEVELPEKTFEDVRLFLECIYPDIYRDITCDIACTIVPLTEELQARKQLERCEQVIFEHVSTRFSDGKESRNVPNLFYYLHLSEKHTMIKVLHFCTLVASELTASDRHKGMSDNQISTDLEMKIVKFAEQRHEIRSQDDCDLFKQYKDKGYSKTNKQTIHHYTLPRFVSFNYVEITNPVNVPQFYFNGYHQVNDKTDFGHHQVNDKTEVFRRHLRGLRLAFLHCQDDKELISKAVKTVREDMKDKGWNTEFQHQYDLLPRKIKSYLKGRLVVEF